MFVLAAYSVAVSACRKQDSFTLYGPGFVNNTAGFGVGWIVFVTPPLAMSQRYQRGRLVQRLYKRTSRGRTPLVWLTTKSAVGAGSFPKP